jgi:lysyl-tRNA synthetase class 2
VDLQRLSAKIDNLKRRAEMIRLIRRFFYDRGYLEVETPSLADCPIPEAFIEPIATERGCLLPSPELYMKPLLAAGFGDVFQICHAFRKGEKGSQHREEFTLLEYYRIDRDYLDLAAETEALIVVLAQSITGSLVINYQGLKIDLSPPWPRLSVEEAFTAICGWNPVFTDHPERFDFELATKVAALSNNRPLILYDFPAKMASLARLKPGEASVAERTEIFVGGLELANIFSELTNPEEQRKRFESELEFAHKQGRKTSVPEDFLEALAQLPEASGCALGIDRLAMLLCDAASIEEVTAFPA